MKALWTFRLKSGREVQDGRESADEAASILRESGHDVHTVWDEALAGMPDLDVSAAPRSERRFLITLDTDFANVHAYPPELNRHRRSASKDTGKSDRRYICASRSRSGSTAQPDRRIVDC